MKINRPKDGDYRYKTKFLWFPRRFDGGWYWLETVTIRQIYFYYVLTPGWYNVCLSNPESGLPISIDPIKKQKVMSNDKTKWEDIKFPIIRNVNPRLLSDDIEGTPN